MNITITFDPSELSCIERDALQTLIGGVSNPVTERQAPVKELAQKPSATLAVSPKPDSVKADKADAPVTLETVRAKAAELSQQSPELKAAAKAAVTKYADKLPNVPADKLADLLADLNALG